VGEGSAELFDKPFIEKITATSRNAAPITYEIMGFLPPYLRDDLFLRMSEYLLKH